MAVAKRLNKVAREFGVGMATIIAFLEDKGYTDLKPTSKIEEDAYSLLLDEYQSDKKAKDQSKKMSEKRMVRETITLEDRKKEDSATQDEEEFIPEPQDMVFIKNVPLTESVGEQEESKIEPKEEPKVESKEEPKEEPKAEESQLDESEEEKIPAVESKEIIEDSNPPQEESAPVAESNEEISSGPKVLDKIDLDSLNLKTRPTKKPKVEPKKEIKKSESKRPEPKVEKPKKSDSSKPEELVTKFEKLSGPTVVGKINIPEPVKKEKKPKEEKPKPANKQHRKRKRITADHPKFRDGNRKKGQDRKKEHKVELTEEQIQAQIRETLARLSSSGKSKSVKHRKAKRDAVSEKIEAEKVKQEEEQKVLKTTEYVTASELATMMNVSVNDIISACMSLGMFVSINQRLDAETLTIVAEEFGYTIEYTDEGVEEASLVEEDDETSLVERPPIVTVMGHVDHGKTSLLDYIRKENIVSGEAGGITQHIGAYNVLLSSGKTITFLDTPGHEAFSAMRSRGAQITDVVIIVIAADDRVMPQTKEAISHAQAAGVPMIFAINKVDRPNSNADKIKEELSAMNILVEDWGGKFQSQEISAKTGQGIDDLLDKVMLESELLELKADASKRANGTVIEAALDIGKGYVSTLLVQSGSLSVGDIVLAGSYFGKVKAMTDDKGTRVKEAGPSIPISMLGLVGAPSAGDKFVVMEDEKEAKSIANKREQLQREQGVRTQKHITLDEIGRRIAIGDFQELNIIVKGDVDGSIEALSDSLLNLSTEKIQINLIHKSVGQISESDVLLASASNAIIIGFQVRPSASARKLAEKESIDIRLYSVIYKAIEEVKDAMEGMLKPKLVEEIVCNIEVRETFKISKVGTIAGCYVLDGTVNRNTRIRLIRDGIVAYSGALGSLKRFKDDVKEVKAGYECGLNIENFNDIKVGDIIEGYQEVEVKQSL